MVALSAGVQRVWPAGAIAFEDEVRQTGGQDTLIWSGICLTSVPAFRSTTSRVLLALFQGSGSARAW